MQQVTEREQDKGFHKSNKNTVVNELGQPIPCWDRISFEVGKVLLNLSFGFEYFCEIYDIRIVLRL